MARVFMMILLLTLTMMSALVRAADSEEPKPVYECERAAKPIDVAGSIAQFDGAPRLYVRDESMVRGQGWRGVDDLSATLRMRFDQQNLYVLVEVMDNDLEWPTEPNEYIWSLDAVQLAFDPKLDGGLSGYGPDDSEYLFTQLHGKPFTRRMKGRNRQQSGDIKDWPVIVSKHPTVPGWYAIAIFAWEELGISEPKAGTKLGFDVLINDKDNGRDRIFMEWTPGIGQSKRPSCFGELQLVEKASSSERAPAGAAPATLTLPDVESRSETTLAKAAELEKLLKQAESARIDTRDERITWNTAVLFAGYAVDDAKKGKLRRAGRVLRHIESALPRAAASVQKKIDDGGPIQPAPVSVSDVAMRNGHFYSGDRPVFLWGVLDAPPEWAPKLGFNYAYFWAPLEQFYASPDAINMEKVGEVVSRLREYRQSGLAVSFLLGMHYFPSAFYRDFPDTRHVGPGKSFVIPCVESPNTRKLFSLFFREVPPILKREGLLNIELANELGYACRCEHTQEMFRAYLQQQYKTDEAFSKAWGSSQIIQTATLPDEKIFGAAGYDWHDFNQNRVTDAFTAFSNEVTQAAPGLATDIKVVAGRAFDGSDRTWGIDHEKLAQSTVLSGQDSYFAEAGLSRAMLYDLYRSFAGGRCIVDNECAYIRPGATAEDVRLNMWVSATHGESGAALYSWNRTEETPDVEDTIATQPWSVEAVGHTSRQINDLAPEIVALANAVPQVRILYSRSSSIQSPHEHLGRLTECYRTAAFVGAPIGFVTERQLTSGIPPGTKLILVPQADYVTNEAVDGLLRFSNAGGVVLLIGDCLSRTERGFSRDESHLQPIGALSRVGNLEREQLLKLLSQCSIDTCPGATANLEARRIQLGQTELRLYINYGGSDLEVAAPQDAKDLVSGQSGSRIRIQRHSVALLKLPARDPAK